MTPACDLQVLEIDVVLEDIGREDRDLVSAEFTARVAGCEAVTCSHDTRSRMAPPWHVPTGRQESQGHQGFRVATQACYLQVCQLDVVLEDIHREGFNPVVVELPTRVAG